MESYCHIFKNKSTCISDTAYDTVTMSPFHEWELVLIQKYTDFCMIFATCNNLVIVQVCSNVHKNVHCII